MKFVVLVAQWGLGGLLTWSGAAKLRTWSWFSEDIVKKMDVLPDRAADVMAAVVPGIEVVTGILLIVGFRRRGAASIAALLFVAFAAMLLQALIREIPTNCGCFGPASDYPVDAAHVVIDLGLAVAAVFVAASPESLFTVDSFFDRRSSVALPEVGAT